MTLLDEIRDGAVAEDVSVSTLLRQARVLAARLGHAPLEKWVENELGGYPPDATLPDYRAPLAFRLQGDFYGAGMKITNATIPVEALPDGLFDGRPEKPLHDPIGDLEELASSEHGVVKFSLPGNLAPYVNMFEGMECLQIWGEVPTLAYKSVVNKVRNRVLTFALAIEKENPSAGEAVPGTEPIAEAKIAEITNTVIYGGTNVIAVGSPGAIQTATSGIEAGDIQGLIEELHSLGVGSQDLDELREAIDADHEADDGDREDGFGPRVKGWIGHMAAKAATGAWQVGSAASAHVLGVAIAQYYGLA